MVDDADRHRDKRQRRDSGREEEVDQMEVEPITQATNHDRNDEMEVDGAAKVVGGVSAAQLMVDEKTLEQLQEDMGDAFLLCRSSKTLPSSATYNLSLQVC
jgi:cell division protein FtsX